MFCCRFQSLEIPVVSVGALLLASLPTTSISAGKSLATPKFTQEPKLGMRDQFQIESRALEIIMDTGFRD